MVSWHQNRDRELKTSPLSFVLSLSCQLRVLTMSQIAKSGLCIAGLTLLGVGCVRSDPPPAVPIIDSATGEEVRAIRGIAKGSDQPQADNSSKSAQ